MKIYIPTRGRANMQKTLSNLPAELQKLTYLVVDHGARDEYRATHKNVIELPKSVTGIASIRQYIMENATDRYITMLDDDLRFQKTQKDWRIMDATPNEILAAFRQMSQWLKEGYAHCSLCPRFIYYDKKDFFVKDFRMMHVLAYDVKTVLKAKCSFTKGVPKDFSMDDFHMTLQLLRSGHGNIVSLLHRTSPAVSNSRGGASEWRTLASHNRSANLLAAIHAPFAKTKTKHGWQGMDGERQDVIVQWKKAAKAGNQK